MIKAKEPLGQSEQSTGKQGNGEKIEKVYRCQSLLITTGDLRGRSLAVMAADMHLLKYLDMRL